MIKQAENSNAKNKLTGWKMISRHLGRSARAVQFWETQRGLPIHRIPGGRGQTVFAYADELDGWLYGVPITANGHATPVEVQPVASLVAPPAVASAVTRPPGILVLPFESRIERDPCSIGDSLCQQLIVRLSAIQPVRVLSWSTSRSFRQSLESMEATASRLNLRYIVETAVERGTAGLHVDVRVVDGDIDQIMLADRFVVSENAPCTAYAQIAEGVALHFALIHAGALVEPICLCDMTPAVLLSYLEAARHFLDDTNGSTERALCALDQVLEANSAFDPALALRGLVLMQMMQGTDDQGRLDEASDMLVRCGERNSARVTAAFLRVALLKYAGSSGAVLASIGKAALRWIPSSIVCHGRLYERRSRLRREHDLLAPVGTAPDRLGQATWANGHRLLGDLLRDLAAVHHRH